MSRFPDPIPLPQNVPISRRKRRAQLIKALGVGVIIRLVIVLAEMFGYWVYGSASLMLEALSTSADLCSSFFLIACVYFADRSPDSDHPFGHGRYEPLGGLQLGLLIFVLSLVMTVHEMYSLLGPVEEASFENPIFLIPLAAVGLLELGYRVLMRIAHAEKSSALKADALHFRLDALSSIIATLSLIGAAYWSEWSFVFDHCGAMLIALFMAVVGAQAVWENLHQIMDRRPDESYFELVRNAAMRVEGVLDTEKIRLQVYGPDAHVAIDIEVDPQMNVLDAHEITQRVRTEVQKSWPAVRDVLVHVEPYYPNDH